MSQPTRSKHFNYLSTRTDNGRQWSNYLLTDYTSSTPVEALAVASASRLSNNQLEDLPALYEYELLALNAEQIQQLQAARTPFLFIIDLTSFPYISTAFDFSDPAQDSDSSEFHQSIVGTWQSWSGDTVMTICVNMNINHTGLKNIRFPAATV